MIIDKKYKRDAKSETAFNIELFLDKETNKVSYLDKNRIPKEIAPASEGAGGSEYLNTSVTVTAAEIIAASTVGDIVKTLIPSPGAGKYLLVNWIVVKFKDATIAFDQSPSYGLTEFKGTFNLNFFGLGTTPDIAGYANGVIGEVDQSLDLKFNVGTAPSAGDGNFIFEIEYKILDF